MSEKKAFFFDTDGGDLDPGLVVKPSLCASCIKNDDPAEEVFCILNRLGQQETDSFHCDAYSANPF